MRKIQAVLLTIAMMIMLINNVYAGEFGLWTGANGQEEWRYFDETGVVKNKWVQNNKSDWYYCGEDGVLLKNTWFYDTNGKYYYLGSDCAMLHDTTTPDGYTVGSDGAWIKKWSGCS